jgi:outer membrane protein OmpA-like peptidoglycan-associated protein
MKNRFLIALPLAATLMVPAMAQTQSTGDQQQQQQPAATSSQDTSSQQSTSQQSTSMQSQQPAGQSQTDQDLSARQPLQPDTKQGFWGKLNPFARKKYVQRQLSPIRNRVNELDELTAKNSNAIKDVDARATEGIRMANQKATEADQHAVEAGNRAQMANQTAEQANTRLTTVSTVVGNLDQYQPSTQTEIRFRSGQTVLSKKAKDALDEMAGNLKDQKGYVIEVQGFSPGKGTAAVETSQRMADSVVRYLVLEHNVPVYRVFVLGMGNAPIKDENGKTARVRTGRVEVTLLKNGVDQLAQANGSAGSQIGTQGTATQTQGGVTGSASSQAGQQSQQAQPGSVSAPQQPQSQPQQPEQPQQQQVPPPTPR